MGLLRDLTRGVARAALSSLSKAVGDDDDEDVKKQPTPPAAVPAQPASDDGGDGFSVEDGHQVGAPSPTDIATIPENQPPAEQVSAAPLTIQQLEEAARDPKSLFWDPFAIVDALGYKDNPRAITYNTLEVMIWKMPILQSIILTRLREVANFAVPQVDKYSTGMRVALRNKKQRPTPASEAKSQQMERWLLSTGTTENPSGRDDFSSFLQKIVRDSLTFDQMCFEVVPAYSGKPAAFAAVDARTIRLADSTKIYEDTEDKNLTRYVQIYDGQVVAEFTSSEMCFGVRNPSANIRLQGYGQSEPEMLIDTVTALLWAFDYNKRIFSQGTTTKGIINVKGTVPDKQMRSFKRHWWAMTNGVENAWRTPIMNSDELQYVSLQMNNRDMEFNAYMDFLIKIACGIYGIDPMQINFKYGDTGGGKQMFESANASKLTASKDKGLKPLLRFVQDKLNTHLIYPLDEDFQLEFVGLEAASPTEQADLNTKLVKSIKTIDECRAEEDLPPLPDGSGAIILDPVYMQHLQGMVAPTPAPGAPSDGPPGTDKPPVDSPSDDGGELPKSIHDGPSGIAGAGDFDKSLRKANQPLTIEIDL